MKKKKSSTKFGSASSQNVPAPKHPPDPPAQSENSQTEKIPSSPTSHPPRDTAKRGLRLGTILLLLLILLVVLGAGIFGSIQIDRRGSSPSETAQSLSSLSTQPEQVAASFKQSVVKITVATNKGEGLGSGTIIDSRGYIVTNYHVIENAKQIVVELFDGSQLPAQLTGIDPADDLAVIKIIPPAHMAVATIGDSSRLEVAQYVMAIGNPLGITQTVTSGIVSALGRNVPEKPGVIIVDAIQTDAAINPGNSGGALINMRGELIGVPTLTIINPEFNAPASGVGFAIPSDRVKFIVPQLIESGKVTDTGRASLGVSVVTVDAKLAEQKNLAVQQGTLIVGMTPKGPAASSGLRLADVIVQIGDTTVIGAESLHSAILSENSGTKVAVKIYRGRQQMTVPVILGELPASAETEQ